MKAPEIVITLGIVFDIKYSFYEIREKVTHLRKSELFNFEFKKMTPRVKDLEEYYKLYIYFKGGWFEIYDLDEVLDILLNDVDITNIGKLSKEYNADSILHVTLSANKESYPSFTVSSSQLKLLSELNNLSFDVEISK